MSQHTADAIYARRPGWLRCGRLCACRGERMPHAGRETRDEAYAHRADVGTAQDVASSDRAARMKAYPIAEQSPPSSRDARRADELVPPRTPQRASLFARCER